MLGHVDGADQQLRYCQRLVCLLRKLRLERAAAAFGDVADGADAAYAAAVAAAEAAPPPDRSDAVATDVELAVLRPSGCVICDADELAERFERRAPAKES